MNYAKRNKTKQNDLSVNHDMYMYRDVLLRSDRFKLLFTILSQ